MKVREGARQTMAWLHGWSGLFLGWVLFTMALSGTLSVLRPEIGRWMRPETTATRPAAEAVANAVGWLQQHAAKAPAWYLVAPGERANTVDGGWLEGADYVLRALDPVTGAPAPRETEGGEFFYRFHFELQLPYPWGRILASLAAAVMLLALLTGIIAHRRFFRDFFTFRPGRGQRAWLDGHNVLGVLALPFHIMITFTGLVTLASLTMPWGVIANYGSDTEAMFRDFTPGAIDRAAAGKPGALAPLLPMLHEAERRFGGGVIGRVSITNPSDAASIVTVYQSDDGQLATSPHVISFDGPSGRILADQRETRPVMKTYGVVYGLHMARFAPWLLRWLYVASGLALTLAIATGMVLWIVKRRERAPLSRANRIVERVNIGVLIGLPLAFAAYFWANRLLPPGLAERSAAEVAWVFRLWGLAMLAALALPTWLAWRAVPLGAAALWIALPIIDQITRPVAASPVTLIGDALMAIAGLTFLVVARLCWSRPAGRRG